MGVSKVCAARMVAALRGIVAAGLVMCCVGAAHAQCVGDCSQDGVVTVSDLIIGVNIALERQPPSVCPPFQNAQGRVDISQLILGVNNALRGCPATPTATMSAEAATSTATPIASPTETSTGVATATETAVATATETAVATATETNAPTATSTDAVTGTPQATATATSTAVDTATASATATQPATATSTPLPTTTVTPFPIGEAVAGNVALVSTGVGSVQSIITAVIAQVTNQGPGLTEVVVTNGIPDVDACPVSGTTSQLCTEMGPSNMRSIHLELGADACVADGPAGGSAEFDGDIIVDSNPGNSLLNGCNPVRFLNGTYSALGLTVKFRTSQMQTVLQATANVTGNVMLATTFPLPACIVTSVSLTLNGDLVSQLPGIAQTDVDFNNTSMVMDQITFNEDCVPLQYRLTFNGPATIHSTTEGEAPVQFGVTFTNYRMVQNANVTPPTVSISGNMSSDCFGGQVGLQTLVPVATAAGELCPTAGQVTVSRAGTSATVTYGAGGAVTIDQAGFPQQTFPSCVDVDLMQCS